MPPPADRYRVNDALGALASEFGVDLDDATLNELTHTVADVLDRAADPANRPAAPASDPAQALARALLVMVLDHQHRTWMADHDPMALQQGEEALRAADHGARLAEAAAVPPPLPEPNDPDYLRRAFGYATLDDLAVVLWERAGADDRGPGVAEVKRRMATFGPETLWERVVGPTLARLEALLGLAAEQ